VSELPEAAGEDGDVGEALLDELDGALEPLAALPLGAVGAALELELDEPPEAGAAGAALDEELELLSVDAGGVTETEPEAEPELGAVEDEPDGGVVEPADEDDEEPGALAPVFGASRSQAVSKLAPSARETAVARMESLMRPPWLGYHPLQQHSGQPIQRQ
jgi:hypothetical protein